MSPSKEDKDTIEEDMRTRTLSMLSQDIEAAVHFLNRFFFWKGALGNDAQFACHNQVEHFLMWLMGGKPPEYVDQRYTEELEVLLGGAIDKTPQSGESYIRDRPRRRRVNG